jgi:hypothetical protein
MVALFGAALALVAGALLALVAGADALVPGEDVDGEVCETDDCCLQPALKNANTTASAQKNRWLVTSIN